MKGRLVTYSPTLDIAIKEYDKPIPLRDLQSAIGGYIEVVPLWDQFKFGEMIERAAVFCDEDGKGKNLPLNHAMTVLWRAHLSRLGRRTTDYLVGPIAVVTGDDEFMNEL